MSNNDCFLGIDFGGTFVKLALIGSDGRIFKKRSFPTSEYGTKEALINELKRMIVLLVRENKIVLKGIGIGVPGQVDYEKGLIHNLTNVKGWKKVPLKGILSKHFQVPVSMDNDGNAAALGEMLWGAAKSYSNILAVTLGTGVGGGIIINGEVYRGAGFVAGEIGHMVIDMNGPACNCGSNGCLESFVGNRAIVDYAINKVKNNKKAMLIKMCKGDFKSITPKLIDEAARKGDVLAISIWEDIASILGVGLSNLVNILNPQIIVIGGGVSKTGKFFFDRIKSTIKEKALKANLAGLKVVRAKFVDDAGVVGSAALIKREIEG
ncbi:MAG: ROK family protein [Candidatus Omnitrophota bacterium]